MKKVPGGQAQKRQQEKQLQKVSLLMKLYPGTYVVRIFHIYSSFGFTCLTCLLVKTSFKI